MSEVSGAPLRPSVIVSWTIRSSMSLMSLWVCSQGHDFGMVLDEWIGYVWANGYRVLLVQRPLLPNSY